MKSAIKYDVEHPGMLLIQGYGRKEKEKLLEYMTKFDDFAVAGHVIDRVTGEELKQENLCYTDGVFQWCSQDIYHVEKYNVAVTDEFYSRIMN